MEIQTTKLSLQEKLNLLADAAKYDVACTSSGSSRAGKKGHLGNAVSAGICHSFASDGRCVSLLKILLSNDCIFDCKYCINRCTNQRTRATFTPEELCTLVIEFYRRNYIEGLFLSSGVVKSPCYTMELMYQSIYMLRNQYHFNGYIHVKAIPGAPEELLTRLGYLVDRMSINIEFSTFDGLKALAPHKEPKQLISPIRHIQAGIAGQRLSLGKDPSMERHFGNRYLSQSIFKEEATQKLSAEYDKRYHPFSPPSNGKPTPFVPAGQSTQMIIGAAGENDLQLLTTTQKLYQQFDLKRVFFSAYIPLNEDAALPALETAPPLLREHRLYQADWLLRFYGFQAEELLSTSRPNFNILLDPKCDWALRHLELFPVEISQAPYEKLLRVPGIGTKSASRIIKSRRMGTLNFDHLKKIGVVLKRAKYFITCSGRMMERISLEEDLITRRLIGDDAKKNWSIDHPETFRQLSLFDDFHFNADVSDSDVQSAALGQL